MPIAHSRLYRERLKESLVRSRYNATVKENDKACNIIFTAFRLWIVHMARNQPHYQLGVASCIDWNAFVEETNSHARTIRRLSDYDPAADTFKVRILRSGAERYSHLYKRFV